MTQPDTILLLEDEMLITLDIEDALTDSGYTKLQSFNRCEEALHYLQTATPDAALIDIHLRDAISRDVVAILHQRGVPFVVYSGMPSSSDEHGEIFLEGLWLEKPATPEQLVEAIKKCAAQRRRHSSVSG